MKLLKHLFSKAVILTYIFIGYLSITDNNVPVCDINPIQKYQTDQTVYPSSWQIKVSTANHIRPVKFASYSSDIFSESIHLEQIPLRQFLLYSSYIIYAGESYLSSSSPRAPPLS